MGFPQQPCVFPTWENPPFKETPKDVFISSPWKFWGEMIHFDEHIFFSDGLEIFATNQVWIATTSILSITKNRAHNAQRRQRTVQHCRLNNRDATLHADGCPGMFLVICFFLGNERFPQNEAEMFEPQPFCHSMRRKCLMYLFDVW